MAPFSTFFLKKIVGIHVVVSLILLGLSDHSCEILEQPKLTLVIMCACIHKYKRNHLHMYTYKSSRIEC